MSEWISVEDRLPDEHKNAEVIVSILDEDGDIFVESGIYFYDNKFHQRDQHYGCDDIINHVTHWQPLPQPPQGK